MPGYRTSTWLNDGAGTGTCVVVFDTAAQAHAGLATLTREGGPRGHSGRGARGGGRGLNSPRRPRADDLYCGGVGTQVTIVGGGSYQWGPELMADLFGTPALAGMHLVLQDIDPVPLPKMEALAHKLTDAMDAKATVATTTDLPAALDGADFVIVCISTGGFRSMAVDLDVPAAHGISQTVGDTVGPGGINRALRNIPVLVGIGKAMEEHCPDAWLFNITNPMTALTRSVCRETSIKTVGLCHEVGNFCMDLAIALGRPFEAVSASVTGINHFPVVTSLDVDGADGLEVLRELIEEVGGLASLAPYPGRPEAEKFSKLDFAERHMFKLTLLDRWGTFPAAGDRHIAEFVSFALTPESDWGAAYNIALSPDLEARGAPGRLHRRRRRLARRDQGPPDLAVGRASLADDPGHADRGALRGAGEHPELGPGGRPARRRRPRVDLRDRRRWHPGT